MSHSMLMYHSTLGSLSISEIQTKHAAKRCDFCIQVTRIETANPLTIRILRFFPVRFKYVMCLCHPSNLIIPQQ